MPAGYTPNMPSSAGQPTCFQKMRMGFMMGAMIGTGMGVLLGGFTGFRAGLRGTEIIKHTGKTIVQSGGSFGIFMSVAQMLRC